MDNNLILRYFKRTGRFLLVSLVYPLRPPKLPLSEIFEGIHGRTALIVGFATLTNYLVWLGWDQTKDVGPDGNLTGPYQSWQIIGLVLVLAVIAAVTGYRHRPWTAAIVTTVVMMLCFAVNGAMDPRDDGLFMIGAIMVAFGTFLGVGLVALVADGFAGGKSGWHRRPWIWVVMTVMVILTILAFL